MPEEPAVTVRLAAPVSVTVTLDTAGEIVPEMVQVDAPVVTLRSKVFDAPEYVAVRIAVWELETEATVAVKLPDVAPEAMVMLAGTVTLVLLLDSATVAPLLGTAALRVAVQVEEPGPVTLAGLHESPLSAGCAASVKLTED